MVGRVGERRSKAVERGLQLGLDRVWALPQGRRDLLDRQIGVVAQHDRRAHLEGKARDAFEQRDPRRGVCAEVAGRGPLRHDLEPNDTRSPPARRHRTVRGDAQDPGSKRTLVAQLTDAVVRGEDRLDNDVLCRVPVAQDEIGDGLNVAPIEPQELIERCGLAAAQRLDGHRVPSLPGDIRRGHRRIDARTGSNGLVAHQAKPQSVCVARRAREVRRSASWHDRPVSGGEPW